MRKCCANCDWFALEPGKRKSGACLKRWYEHIKVGELDTYGAYGCTFSFDKCSYWVPQGTLERLEPEMIGGQE